jgi:hypothetical protein
MGEAPDEIRREIEATRARMGDTVEAIGYRADVKGRAKETVVEKKDSMLQKGRRAVDRVVGAMPDVGGAASGIKQSGASAASGAGDAASAVASAVGDAVPSGEQMRQAASVAQSNPLGLLVGAAAVGFVVGLAVPSTRLEDEKIGDLANDLKRQAREVGGEAVQHGQQVAQEAARAATEAAQEAGEQHGQKLAETVQQRAQDLGRRD